MYDTTKTTRKNFLVWSGLAFVGGLLFSHNRFSDLNASEPSEAKNASKLLAKMPQVRPARNSVVRESV